MTRTIRLIFLVWFLASLAIASPPGANATPVINNVQSLASIMLSRQNAATTSASPSSSTSCKASHTTTAKVRSLSLSHSAYVSGRHGEVWASVTNVVHSQFEKFTEGATPPTGFAGVDWTGWTVTNESNYPLRTKGGGSMIITAPGFFGNTLHLAGGVLVANIIRFDFGCTLEIYTDDGPGIPQPCAITMTSLGFDWHEESDGFGPWSFSVDYSKLQEGIYPPLTQVNLINSPSSGRAWAFNLYSASSTSGAIYLDNLVFELPNLECPNY